MSDRVMRVYFPREVGNVVENIFETRMSSSLDFDRVLVMDNGWVQLFRDGKLLNLPPTSILLAERIGLLTEDEL